MLDFGRGVTRASLLMLALGAALPASAAADKDKLSELKDVVAKTASDDITVVLTGSKAPDFTSFTMNAPFRVVVDWAGSRLVGVAEEKRFEQGLIRRITTRQFDSEAEKISRVTIELARETTYHVETDGKNVVVHFVPVPDPIPEPAQPAVAVAAEPAKKVEVAKTEPEGPLTEPAIAVPDKLPELPKKAEAVIAKEAPKAAATVAQVDPKKPDASKPATPTTPAKRAETEAALASAGAAGSREIASVKDAAKVETKPTAVAQVEKPAEPTPVATVDAKTSPANDLAKIDLAKTDLAKVEPTTVAKASPTPKAEPKTEPKTEPTAVAKVEPKTEPKTEATPVAKAEPKADAKTEPVRLASFDGVTPEKQPIAKAETKSPAEVKTPPTVAPDHELSSPPARLASNVPANRERVAQWQPPTIPLPKKLPVVRYASAQDGQVLQPTAKLPADPDEPAETEKTKPTQPVSAKDAKDANDFDPGPRVMKYIGFQQMADASRVFVRLDGKAKYKPTLEGTSFVLELSSTRINVKNNERMLDTTYFNTPVQKVQAVPSGDTTRIEVKLKEPVPYKISRIGNTIAIDFQRAK